MNVKATIKEIKTIHTSGEGARVDQPIVEFTLSITKDGDKDEKGQPKEYELKFTEMLCNLANLDAQQLANLLEMYVKDYVETAFGWTEAIESKTGDWANAKDLIGKTYNISI